MPLTGVQNVQLPKDTAAQFTTDAGKFNQNTVLVDGMDYGQYDPNQDEFCQTTDLDLQSLGEKEWYAIQLVQYSQSMAEHNAALFQQQSVQYQQENMQLHATLQQQSTLPIISSTGAPFQPAPRLLHQD